MTNGASPGVRRSSLPHALVPLAALAFLIASALVTPERITPSEETS
jgi:hypothetical protein